MDLEARLVNDGIESQPFANSTRIEASAQFSPDGKRIAFASYPFRDPGDLARCSAMGASCSRSRRSAPLNWSLAGGPRTVHRIVFDATVAGNSDVYVVGADGGRVRRLTSEPSIDGLSVVVGRWLLDLFLLDARGSNSRRLADRRLRAAQPNG